MCSRKSGETFERILMLRTPKGLKTALFLKDVDRLKDT
jgi:hypothetical protein